MGKKSRITITIDDDLLEWLDKNVDSKYFANRSHGFEFLIKRRMDTEQTKRQKRKGVER